MASVARLEPNGDGFGGETPVGHAHNAGSAWLQDPRDLREDLKRADEVVDAHHAGDHIETLVAEGKGGVHVEVLSGVGGAAGRRKREPGQEQEEGRVEWTF